ncbi:unnamed protein product [Owenia fusiformis]|uniref:SOCS box domain-containing protein n=1 Tax=Owenia fusiformis TaxID=6347 RepID=A0A8S4Q4L8_OWEFU|nr:unnamed protein product [Owenia fusiformis]
MVKRSSISNFLYSVSTNNLHETKKILKAGIDVNHRCGRKKRTVLFEAAAREFSSMTQLLLENGADPNITDNKGNNVLQCAIQSTPKSIKTIELLLRSGADILNKNQEGLNSLYMVIRSKSKVAIQIMNRMLQSHPEVTSKENYCSNMSPLTYAFNVPRILDTDKVKILIQNSGDIEDTVKNNDPPNAQDEESKATTDEIVPSFEKIIKMAKKTGSYELLLLFLQHNYIPSTPKLLSPSFFYFSTDYLKLVFDLGFNLWTDVKLQEFFILLTTFPIDPELNAEDPNVIHPGKELCVKVKEILVNKQPRSLQNCSRVAIKRSLTPGRHWEKIDTFEIPENLREYLKYKGYNCDGSARQSKTFLVHFLEQLNETQKEYINW